MYQKKLLIIAGIIISIFGMIFYMQGQAVLGPESSFMYSNPDWISYGLQIIIIGFLIIVGGVVLHFFKKT